MSPELLKFAKREIFANTRVSCGLSTMEPGLEPVLTTDPLVTPTPNETQLKGGVLKTDTKEGSPKTSPSPTPEKEGDN